MRAPFARRVSGVVVVFAFGSRLGIGSQSVSSMSMRAPCGCPGRTIRAGGFHLGRPDKLGRRGGPGCVGCREGSACHPGDNPRGSIVQVEPGAGGWPGLIPAPVLQDSQRLSRVWRYPPGLIACYVRAACPSTPQPPAPKLEIQRSLLHSKPEARPNFRNTRLLLCLPASWPCIVPAMPWMVTRRRGLSFRAVWSLVRLSSRPAYLSGRGLDVFGVSFLAHSAPRTRGLGGKKSLVILSFLARDMEVDAVAAFLARVGVKRIGEHNLPDLVNEIRIAVATTLKDAITGGSQMA